MGWPEEKMLEEFIRSEVSNQLNAQTNALVASLKPTPQLLHYGMIPANLPIKEVSKYLSTGTTHPVVVSGSGYILSITTKAILWNSISSGSYIYVSSKLLVDGKEITWAKTSASHFGPSGDGDAQGICVFKENTLGIDTPGRSAEGSGVGKVDYKYMDAPIYFQNGFEIVSENSIEGSTSSMEASIKILYLEA